MAVFFQDGYTLPSGGQDLRNARLAYDHIAGAVAASSAAADYPAAGANLSITTDKWKAESLPATWSMTPVIGTVADYCCIGAHNMGAKGAVVSVQYQAAYGASWAEIMQINATDNSAIMCIFEPVTGYGFRIEIVRQSGVIVHLEFDEGAGSFVASAGDIPEIGFIGFGVALQMPFREWGGVTPPTLNPTVSYEINKTQGGEFAGALVASKGIPVSHTIKYVDRTFCYGPFKDFQAAARLNPFFYAWNPLRAPEDCVYMWTTSEPTVTNTGPSAFMAVSIQGQAVDGL